MKNVFYGAILFLSLCCSGFLQAKSTINIVITDHLGTPQQLVDQNQEVVWKASYTPFGNATIEVQKVFFNQRFPGQYYDKETGTHYNYYRDYDPNLGRYLQSDPIGIIGDYSDPQLWVAYMTGIPLMPANNKNQLNHVYSYVESNPTSFFDQYGLDVICGNKAVWISNGDGTGYCRETRDQGSQCASGDCNAYPKSMEDSCVKKCIAIRIVECADKNPRAAALCAAIITTQCSQQTCDKCDEAYK